MMKYLLDTNAVIHFLHNKYSIERKIESVRLDNCFISEMTLAELYFGAYKSVYVEANLLQADELHDSFNVLPISRALKKFGYERARIDRKRLRDVKSEDLLIGATAIVYEMTLVSQNTKDFINMENLKLEDWTKPRHNEFL